MPEVEAASPPSDTKLDDVFPLPMAPFERFMLLDDRPRYPIVFAFRLRFRGHIEREPMEEGVRFAAARHPLLRSLVHGRKWITTDRVPQIVWGAEGEPLEEGYADAIDLRRDTGVQIWVRQGEKQAEMLFRFHHATVDAMGAYQFFEDMLAKYHSLAAPQGKPLTLRELDAERLRERGSFGLTPPPIKEQLKQLFAGLREAATYYRRVPQPLATPQPFRESGYFPAGHDGFLSAGIDQRLFRRLRSAAQKAGASLNDLLLRDLFRTARQWNARRGRDDAESWMQLMMPCGLRESEDKTMPAANVMSYAFLTQKAAEVDDPQSLLTKLAEATEAIRRYRLSLYFVGAVGTADAVPGLLGALLRMPRCFATTLLTNVGDPSRRFSPRFPRQDGLVQAGNLVLQDVDGAPPLRPRTRASFSAHTYGGRMRIGIRCDRYYFTVEDMQELLDLYFEQLEESASAEQAASTPACGD